MKSVQKPALKKIIVTLREAQVDALNRVAAEDVCDRSYVVRKAVDLLLTGKQKETGHV